MKTLSTILLFFVLSATAWAEMISVSSYEANIHSSPILYEYNIILRAPRYYPFEVLGKKDDFYRVSDYEGRTGWVHKTVVSSTPTVIIRAANANIRKGAGTKNLVVFRAKRGVTFKVLKRTEEWIQVEHENGQVGWVFHTLAWGSK